MSWDARYFECSSKEEAAALGAQWFQCGEDCIVARMVREPAENRPGLALVLYGKTADDRAAAGNMDGMVRLQYTDGGVYAQIFPSLGRGKPLERPDAAKYIQRKGLSGLNTPALLPLLEAGMGMEKIAPPQEETLLGQDLELRITDDQMEAHGILLPPDPGGPTLDEEGMIQRLNAAGVVAGINKSALKYMLIEQKYGKTYTLAKGRRPVDGENGKIIFHFRRTLTAAPRVVDEKTDKVDYHTLDLFEPATQGQKLVERTLATPGTPGVKVTGEEIAPRPGKDVVLPRGKNLYYNDEKTIAYAQTSGMVQYERGAVNVQNVYVVRGNCDMSTGNIIFDGNVDIKGGVISGMTIRATGSVVVGGVVEGASIESGGDIVLKLGMQGMDRGSLTAAGDITAQFIERSLVQAGGNLTADAVMHSKISVGGVLTIKGKRGVLVGGTAKVAREAVVRSLGTQAHTATSLEVGVLPTTLGRVDFLRAELRRIDDEGEKLQKLRTYLEKTGVLDEARTKLYNSIGESEFVNAQTAAEYNLELERLTAEIEHASDGKVHVLETAYPGARIGIASAKFLVQKDIPYATFRYSEGEISYIPCEAGRG